MRSQLIKLTLPEYDFLDQPEWIRQQSQSGGGTNHAVAYKRIQFRYCDLGQLTDVNLYPAPAGKKAFDRVLLSKAARCR